MNKLTKKTIIGLVSATLLAIPFGTTALSVSAQSQTTAEEATMPEEKLVPITLYSDENKTIITEVPESYAEEYTQKLQDKEFRQQEILNSFGSQSDFQVQSSTVRYMGETDILEMLNHLDHSRNWLQYVNNPLGSSALSAAIRIITGSNIMGALGTVLAWGAQELQTRQLNWWKDSAIMVLSGEINGVKSTITPSGKNYPKVYRTLERY
ncbi:MAG: hypothetical protein L0J18_12355 [Tetragenococcus koreensis]|nr:hypothetical protein [Tetragenococcus koreensis]